MRGKRTPERTFVDYSPSARTGTGTNRNGNEVSQNEKTNISQLSQTQTMWKPMPILERLPYLEGPLRINK